MFYFYQGYCKAVAEAFKIDLRLGLDWDSDLDFMDQNLYDGPHIELR